MENILTKKEFLKYRKGKGLIVPRIIFMILFIYLAPTTVLMFIVNNLSRFIKFFTAPPVFAMFIFLVLFLIVLSIFIVINVKASPYRNKFSKLYDSKGSEFKKQVIDCLNTDDIEKLAELLELKPECNNEEFAKYLADIGAGGYDPSITDSRFVGKAIGYFFHRLLWGLLLVITFGIAYPFVVVMKQKYLANRTYTTGHKNLFNGNGFQLIGKYILWIFLTIITFGIFSIWLITKLIKWKTSHTHFIDSEVKESTYDGNGFVRYFLNIGLWILACITFGLAYPFKVCALNRYDKKHSIIDGYRLKFTGTAMQYFGKHILWTFLSIITIGIYYIFVSLKKEAWVRKHTIIDETYQNNLQPKKENAEVIKEEKTEVIDASVVEENKEESTVAEVEEKPTELKDTVEDESITEDNQKEI